MTYRVIRGSRLTGLSNSGADVDRGVTLADRWMAVFWCGSDHRTAVVFSDGAEPPEQWPCAECGDMALAVRGNAVRSTRRIEGSHKTPYEFMMMRRTEEDGERLLEEALRDLRKSRASRRAR